MNGPGMNDPDMTGPGDPDSGEPGSSAPVHGTPSTSTPNTPNTPHPEPTDDLTVVRVDQFFPHPPAKVWRALTDPSLLVQWQMQGSEDFRLEVGHRYRLTAVPRPNVNFSGVVDVMVLGYDVERMLSLRWADADPANPADWTVTWTLEQEGRGTRLFLVHEGFDPDDPAQLLARTIMGGGWRAHVMPSLGQTLERM